MLETRVDCVDFLAQLDEEVVSAYDVTDETITNIVTALLAMQLHVTPVTLGTIEPVVTRSIMVEDQQDSILGVLSKLRDTVGGYIEVDTSRQLNWWNDIGEDKGQQIRYKKNIKGLSRTLEFTNFGNRLYCYGAGEGSARIKLSDSIPLAVDYIENVPSQGTYGMCIRQLTDKSITDPDVLYEWAVLKLAEMKDPRHSYRVDMVNLAAQGWTFEHLILGSMVKVIDEDLGVDINARIVKIIRDLSNPINIQVEISNPGKDIIDSMSGVYDTQQFYDHIATKIGAGQVTVLGAFAVSDWVTGGTTNIIGDYVRTGTIESSNWAVGAGSQFNLNDGTFKLGGSASPKLSWNGTTLTVQGTIYATAGEFTGTLKATTLQGGTTLTISGTISAGGGNVKISSTGINIFGLGNALTTRATEAGTIQCYVGSDGKLYAGGGRIILSSTGLLFDSSGTYGWLTFKNISAYAYFYLTSDSYFYLGNGVDPSYFVIFPAISTSISGDFDPSTAGGQDLGNASVYWNVINYKTLTDRGCPMPTFKSHTEAIMGMKTHKRKLTITEAKKEGMGSRVVERIQKHGTEIEEFDLDNFPEDYLDIPTQKDFDDAEKDHQQRLRNAKEKNQDPSKVIKYEPKRGYCLNEIVYSLVRSQQEIIERLKVLEAK